MKSSEPDGLDSVWPVPPPPDAFVERVLLATERQEAGSQPGRRPRRGPRRTILVGVGTLAAAALAAVWLVPRETSGERRARGRETVSLGRAATAVLEAGSEIQWSIHRRGSEVQQPAGTVFYRVDRGGRFAVHTPGGTAEVLGTCFRLEVQTMRPVVQNVASAMAGAAAATVVVTVFEGSVLFKSARGQMPVSAGESLTVEPGEPPRPSATRSAPAAGGDHRLRGQIQQQERTIAALNGKVAVLNEQVAVLTRDLETTRRQAIEGEPDAQGIPKNKFVDFNKEELAALAKRCEVRYDMPPVALRAGEEMSAAAAARAGFSEGERGAINEALREMGPKLAEDIRRIYVEATGDRAGAQAMTLRDMQHAVFNKDVAAMGLAKQQVSQERAGLASPPPDLKSRSAAERMLRAIVQSGEDWEKKLASIFGAEKAHEWRRRGDMFGGRRIQNGCPGQVRP
jgi:hypothetical protein